MSGALVNQQHYCVLHGLDIISELGPIELPLTLVEVGLVAIQEGDLV